ncbi:uncharacterized protein BP01DRAFT_308646 [Aspergillus saccharolyticus JOP 1030-1]|uniref:Uncharacterized protein n=1 Tax=Aspergillus saccharolyticus JOP 1030-1 TaxID=1450539 RepID=A0A318Z9W5_9EURO|nr:hypothetical protein BP01DRAFT_308646 [Aspergillus saccharolyticus JOP 1030-1]PYH40310.1 hypothetical protein BP01DRAFT_308646 [Aspergillus saccharolyticus JOP 1030-1]
MLLSIFRTSLTHVLGGFTLLSTFITTILNGICYSFSRSLSSHIASVESAIVSLGTINCAVITALLFLWAKDVNARMGAQWRSHRAIFYSLIAVYLSIATGITAGGIAWSAVQSMTGKTSVTHKHQTLMLSRCVIWAISVLSQGILGGYLLTSLSKRDAGGRWSSALSQELEILPDQVSVGDKEEVVKAPSIVLESQRPSGEGKTSGDIVPELQPSASRTESQTSNRYSGRTLYQHDSKQSSLDLPRTHLAGAESTVPRYQAREQPENLTVQPGGKEERNEPPTIRRSYSGPKRSFEGLPRQSSVNRSSPATSSTHLAATSRPVPPKLKLPDESFIHPLFRSDSASPPPTPMPGTTVIASPAAGQTISVQTLNRVRSTRSLRSHAPRSRSPLFEQVDQPLAELERKSDSPEPSGRESPMPNFILAADVRSSITRYEKKYDLDESPDES